MKLEEIGQMIPFLLNIRGIAVQDIEIGDRGEIVIRVESTKQTGRCHKCGQEISELHGHDNPIKLRHFPMLGHKVYVEIRPKRYICRQCQNQPTSTQEVSWYKAKSKATKAYEEYLLLQLINSTIEDVSLKNDIGYKVIEAILDRHISDKVEWAEFTDLTQIGIDEIALKKGHKDQVAIVTTRSAKSGVRILGVLVDKKKETVKKFLVTIPQALKQTIQTVCTDMYEGFVNAVKEQLPQAKVVVDRYHVAKAYRECVDSMRKTELKRLKHILTEAEYDEIKGAMWPLRKNSQDLQKDEADLLNRLFHYSPQLKQAYDLREALTDIFTQKLSKNRAQKKLKAWQLSVRNSGLTCFDSFLTTLDNWLDEITNYFTKRFNSGFVEGFNNKIKVIKRRCYGIFNLSHLFQRIFLDVNGYSLFASSSC